MDGHMNMLMEDHGGVKVDGWFISFCVGALLM